MTTNALDRLVQESSYIFEAEVTQINASNEPSVRPGPGLIVARVEEAFRASPSVGREGLRGQEVTVQLSGDMPPVGEKLVVFAREWVYGIRIALRAVAHHKATSQAEREVVEAAERMQIRHLESRLDSAVRVIEGEVRSIQPSPVPDGFTLRSPYYQLAVVSVRSTLKGRRAERINVLFPTNLAPPWRGAPRLKERQRSVFILRHESTLKAPAEFFTSLDPADVQPHEMLPKIRSLLKRERTKED